MLQSVVVGFVQATAAVVAVGVVAVLDSHTAAGGVAMRIPSSSCSCCC